MKFLERYLVPLVLIRSSWRASWIAASAQYVPTHISNQGIYVFLDELASEQHISLFSLVKPYSRLEIARLLQEAETARSGMTGRQQAELDFYLRDYARELAATRCCRDQLALAEEAGKRTLRCVLLQRFAVSDDRKSHPGIGCVGE